MKLDKYREKFEKEHPGVSAVTRGDVAFHLGMAVERARCLEGITQRELATRVGMTQSSIARLEAGNSAPNTATLKKIFDAMSTPVHIIFKDGEIDVTVNRRGGGTLSNTIDNFLVESPFGRNIQGTFVPHDTAKSPVIEYSL